MRFSIILLEVEVISSCLHIVLIVLVNRCKNSGSRVSVVIWDSHVARYKVPKAVCSHQTAKNDIL